MVEGFNEDPEEKIESLLRDNLDLFDIRNRTYSPSPDTEEPCDFCEGDAVSTFKIPETDLVIALCVDCLTEHA